MTFFDLVRLFLLCLDVMCMDVLLVGCNMLRRHALNYFLVQAQGLLNGRSRCVGT